MTTPRDVLASNAECFMRMAAASPGGSVLELDGIRAALTPAAPERPLLNSAICLRAGALDDGAYERLSEVYGEAGIHAWIAWIEPQDEGAAAVLAGRGHALDGQPRAMGAPAATVAGRPPLDGELVAGVDMGELTALNDAVYGYPGSFGRAMPSGSDPGFETLGVRSGSRLVAVAGACRVGADCHITMVATDPEFRRRGLASGLIGRLVADAGDAGSLTTSLVATRAGAQVYARLGYRDVGRLDMWEIHV